MDNGDGCSQVGEFGSRITKDFGVVELLSAHGRLVVEDVIDDHFDSLAKESLGDMRADEADSSSYQNGLAVLVLSEIDADIHIHF